MLASWLSIFCPLTLTNPWCWGFCPHCGQLSVPNSSFASRMNPVMAVVTAIANTDSAFINSFIDDPFLCLIYSAAPSKLQQGGSKSTSLPLRSQQDSEEHHQARPKEIDRADISQWLRIFRSSILRRLLASVLRRLRRRQTGGLRRC